MRNRILSMVLAVTLVLGLGLGTAAVAANEAPRVYIDGVEFQYDVAAYGQMTAVSGRIYAPLRVLAEKLGYVVDFVDGKATVDGPKGKVAVDLGKLESMSFAVGSETVTLDVPVAMVVNNRTLIALRGLGEAIGCAVDWKDGAAWISTPGGAGSVENGNISVESVLTEYDPAELKNTNEIGPKLAESFGKDDKLGLPNAFYKVDGLGNNSFLTDVPGKRDLQLEMHVESNGTIVINDSDFSNTKQGQAFMSMVDAFLTDTTNPRIKGPVMDIFNKLVAKLSVDVNGAGGYSEANSKWCEENLHQKAFSLTEDYCIVFSGNGSMYEITIAPKAMAESISNFPL